MLGPCSFLLLSSLLPDTLWRQTSSIKEHHCICSRKHLQMQRADKGEEKLQGSEKRTKTQESPKKRQSHILLLVVCCCYYYFPDLFRLELTVFLKPKQWLHRIYCRAQSHKRNRRETVPCERAGGQSRALRRRRSDETPHVHRTLWSLRFAAARAKHSREEEHH